MTRVLLFSMLVAGQAFGCVCGTFRTPKEEWQQSATVFLGTIETVKTLGNPMNPFVAQQIGVRVEEGFKGARARQLITLENEGGDCSPAFSKGWRRLFYARENGGKLYAAGACGRSSVPESAADDLKFLRALPVWADRTRISGEVQLGGSTRRSFGSEDYTEPR